MTDHKLEIILSARDATKKTFQAVTGRVKALTGSVFSLQGAIATLGGATMLGLVGRDILATGAEYEKTMSKVKAITKAGEKDFKDLSNLAKDLGERTEYTATQVGQLEIAYAKLGLTKSEILEVTGLTLDLATALDADLAEAATVAAGTMNSFNAQARELDRYMDVMAAGTTTTALDMEKFRESMANVGAAAKAYGWDIEQTTAKVGAMVDANIDASKAGTDLRKIITELAKTGMSYDEAMDKIRNSTNKVKTAQELFGQRAYVSAIILSEQQKKVEDLTKQYYNATGSLKEMAGTMRDNVITRWYEFKSAIERVEIDIFEQEAGILNETLKEMAEYVRENREEFVRFANQGVGALYGSVKKIIGLYNSMPDGVVGAAGAGIVGRILFGSWGPAKIVAGIYLLNEQLKRFNADIGTAVDNWKKWEKSINAIMDVIAGRRDWMTGAQIPQAQPIPQTPAAYHGAIGPETPGWEIYQPPKTGGPGGTGGPSAAGGGADKDAEKIKKAFEAMYSDLKFKSDDYYEYRKALLEKQALEYEKYTGDTVLAHQWLTEQIKALDQESAAKRELGPELQQYYGFWSAYSDAFEDFYTTNSEVLLDITKEDAEKTRQAFETMYSDLKFQSEDYYEYRKTQLEKQAEEYEEYTGDEVLAHQWLIEQIKALDKERLEAAQKNNAWLVELSERTSDAIEDNFSKFYRDAFRGELDSAADYFRAFCNTLLDSFSDMLGQMTKELLFGGGSSGGSGLFGLLFSGIGSMFAGGSDLWGGYSAITWHTGGTVGKDSGGSPRNLPAPVFSHAPRLHKGYSPLAPDEFPAILKYDETVLPPGVKPVTNIKNVKNTSISVPISMEGLQDKRLSYELKNEIEELIIRKIREEIS